MSPRKVWTPLPPRVRAAFDRTRIDLGDQVRQERQRRGWTMAELGRRAGVSTAMVQDVEAGQAASLEGYFRLGLALGLPPRFTLLPVRAAQVARAADPVHAAMGEIEAERFRGYGAEVRIDEPYQHYQFAGRADVVAYSAGARALLHVENRTRFPDIQGFAGSFNQKRVYLADQLAERLGIRRFASITHVVVALWSAEVLHVVRLRCETFRSIAPDPSSAWDQWWAGTPPASGSTTTFVLLDPLPGRRASRRRFIGLDEARTAEPRYRGYADALGALRTAGRA